MPRLAIKGGKPLRTKKFPAWPVWGREERAALGKVLDTGNWGGFPSPNTKAGEFAAKFAKYHDAQYGICAANGTVTLETALRAAGVTAGDEVIVPPYTWIATAAAPVYVNAVPVFVDIDPDTYCLDAGKIEAAITERTRAIIPVHLGSSLADMDRIMEIAARHGLIVIEDCAHMHGAKWNNRGVGSIGHFGSFSFQSSKLMTAGEGGIILTNAGEYAEKCHSLVNCGRKEEGYNTFDGFLFGWNYRLTEWQAAVLTVQLGRLTAQMKVREKNKDYFASHLKEIPEISLLKKDSRVTAPSGAQFVFKYNPEGFKGLTRDQFVAALEAEGIETGGYAYPPVYRSPLFPLMARDYPEIRKRYGESLDPDTISCPVTEKASFEESVWLQHRLFLGTRKDIDDILAAIRKIQDNADELR